MAIAKKYFYIILTNFNQTSQVNYALFIQIQKHLSLLWSGCNNLAVYKSTTIFLEDKMFKVFPLRKGTI